MKLDPALLRAARAALGWTRRDLAGRIGINERAVAGWEAGEYRPTPEHAAAVVAAFEQAGVVIRGNTLRLVRRRAAG